MTVQTGERAPADSLAPEMHRQVSWRFWLLRGAFESVLIVLSVVLGLMLTGWADDQREATRIRDMQVFLVQEIQSNRDLVASDQTIPHHKRLHKAVKAVADNAEATRADADGAVAVIMKTGVHFAPTDESVWRSMSAGDLLRHMDPETVFTLARVYRAQENVDMINENLYGLLSRLPAELAASSSPAATMMTMHLALADLFSAEENLVARYDEALARLK